MLPLPPLKPAAEPVNDVFESSKDAGTDEKVLLLDIP